jgi:hypothetical protein
MAASRLESRDSRLSQCFRCGDKSGNDETGAPPAGVNNAATARLVLIVDTTNQSDLNQ